MIQLIIKIISNCSPLEKIYSKENSKYYPDMDYNTKRIYRYNTAEIARKARKSEIDIANEFLRKANNKFIDDQNSRESHVGYYILKNTINCSQELSLKLIFFLSLY